MQPLVITDDQIFLFIGQYLWPMIRLGAFFLAVPVIGARTVPVRIRLVLMVLTTFIVVPVIPPPPAIPLLSMQAVITIFQEILIGLALGFCMQIVMHLYVLAGQFIAMKMGLGFAAMNDPASGVSVAILSQFYTLLTTLLFLSVNGHLVMLDIFINTFINIPVGTGGLGVDSFLMLANMGSWMFAGALVISLPLFTALMIVNMSFGVMGRSAPQMNVFTVGFPATLIFGLALMWISLTNFLPLFYQLMDEGMGMFLRLAEAQ